MDSKCPGGFGAARLEGRAGDGRRLEAYRLLLLDPRHAGWLRRCPARWNLEPGSCEQRRSDAQMAVAATVAAAAAGLGGKGFKRAPQTRRTSPDQPPSPTPPPAALLSAPSAPPAAPNPGDPAAAWAGSGPAPYSLRQQGPPGSEAGPCSPRADSPTRGHPGVKLALSFPAPRGSQSAPTSHPTPRLFKETFLPLQLVKGKDT